jgi:hypothetical protein
MEFQEAARELKLMGTDLIVVPTWSGKIKLFFAEDQKTQYIL